ncbi:MAG: hypothetical protein N4A35_00875 [Flavobacteriales bacterium]|jgi:hypothetical protein|nr:hypothetical protein [Flavobacteriales bacterium]
MKTLILVSLLLFIQLQYCSQVTISTPLSLSISVEEVDNGVMNNNDLQMLDSVMLNDPAMQEDPMIIQYKTELLQHQGELNGLVKMYIILSDTADIAKIHYKMGRAQNSNDVLNGNVVYDDNQIHGAITYSRTLNQIKLVLGMYNNVGDLYGEVYLEDNQGRLSNTVQAEYHKQ